MKSLIYTALVGALAGHTAAQMTVDPATRTFRDEANRARIFHGFNVVVKLPSYIPYTDKFDFDMSLNDDDLELLRSWGTKIIRLGVMWEAVETAPGVYDYDYLAQVNSLIDKIGSYGISVIVDNHQDMFSRVLCGEGVPYFYTPKRLEHSCSHSLWGFFSSLAGECVPFASLDLDYDEEGRPMVDECSSLNFEVMYNSPEVASAFAALYANRDGVQDKLMDYLTVMADAFKDNKHVIGYDGLNEPWPANLYHDIGILLHPDKFDSTELFPMAQRIHTAIRASDDKKAVFFEAAQFPDTLPFLGGITLPIGFPETPGGADYVNRQVLNDHTYCCQASGTMCDDGEPPLDAKEECREFHMQKVSVRDQDAQRFDVPLIFTEFGACFDSQECLNEIESSMDAFDTAMASFAYWQYKSFGDFTTTGGVAEGTFREDGTLQTQKVKALSRTYAYAFQGTPKSTFFEKADGSFTSTWTLDKNATLPTEVYVNKNDWYPNGYRVSANLADGTPIKTLNINFDEVTSSIQLNIDDDELAKLSGSDAQVLVTAAVTENEGQSAANGFEMDWKVEEIDSGCEIKVSFDDALNEGSELWVVNRHNSVFKRFRYDNKAEEKSAKLSCSDLVSAQLRYVQPTSSWFTQTQDLVVQPVSGLNQHAMHVHISRVAGHAESAASNVFNLLF